MTKNSHLEWKVKYASGILLARGYTGGKEILTDKVETTGAPAAIQLTPHHPTIKADGEDVLVITVQVSDAQQRMVPDAGNGITFEITGPGKIIGVGNGDPSSHEPDRYVESVSSLALTGWRSKAADSVTNLPEVAADFDDSSWQAAFAGRGGGGGGGRRGGGGQPTQPTVYRGSFQLPENSSGKTLALTLRSLGQEQSVYLNGQPVAENVSRENATREINLAADALRPGKNVIAIVATPQPGGRGNAGSPGQIRVTTVPGDWKRSLFSGLAQVIVQSTGQPGEITLTAKSQGVTDGVLKLQAQPAPLRPAVTAN
jgi:beta-galactosidase